jgi:uncharacterized protein YhfF
MKITEEVRKFWREFCQNNPEINPDEPFQVWFFSNSRESARELAELVISGKKKATASLVLINEMKPEIAPVDDGYSVVTDFDGVPLCVIQTTEIRYLPFDEVDAQFAFDEGEGDQTLEDWREGHWKYFTGEAGESGVEFNEKSLICCERFALLYPNR